MRIEMGESLFYSWLRHVKECQIVQTNWKASSQWSLSDADELEQLMNNIDNYYSQKYDYAIFKKTVSLSQLLKQGECDVLGVSLQSNEMKYYAVDVAFHEGGLSYGSRDATVMNVLKKCVRTALCLHGYMSTKEAEIIFAAPKINPSILSMLVQCIEELNTIFSCKGYNYNFRIIANEEYNDLVLQPILLASDGIADTSELFLRSYQMYKMFSEEVYSKKTKMKTSNVKSDINELDYTDADIYQELKIGQLAQKVLGRMLRDGYATDEEIEAMQTFEYSKRHFDLQFPLLQVANESKAPLRYYANTIEIKGTKYYMCSEWFEKEGANNDRPYLLQWIKEHKKYS